jgi:hypothetical protein
MLMKMPIVSLLCFVLFDWQTIVPLSQDKDMKAECPSIRVVCPDWVLTGSLMKCTVRVSGVLNPSRLSFSWTTSHGIIKKGERAVSVIIDPKTDGFHGETITASVEVEGLPQLCAKSAKSSANLYVKEYSSTVFKEYGDISFDAERKYLDALAKKLRHDPGNMPSIIAYAGRYGYENEAIERAGRAKNYLIEKHRIEPNRIVTINGGFREIRSVELWIEEPGALNSPVATPTLRPEEVHLLKRKP